MSYISICFYCYVIAQQLPSPNYAVAMNLYQIIYLLLLSLNKPHFPHILVVCTTAAGIQPKLSASLTRRQCLHGLPLRQEGQFWTISRCLRHNMPCKPTTALSPGRCTQAGRPAMTASALLTGSLMPVTSSTAESLPNHALFAHLCLANSPHNTTFSAC